jgi:hypothetical protein
MQAEMERSKSQLKLDGVQAPVYIDYRSTDVDDFNAEAAVGALRRQTRQRIRLARVVVRVGDYKQDSYYRGGEGVVELAPLDDDLIALRHQLWLATDRAYKAAGEALAEKQAQLKQLNVDQPVDDFAHAPEVQHMEAAVRLDADVRPWLALLEEVTALYRSDPEVQSLEARQHFAVTNRYFVNSEGTVVRRGQGVYEFFVMASAQAPDGMKLERSYGESVAAVNELPNREKWLEKTNGLLATLKELRAAPLADEDYHGPVLLRSEAAASAMAALIAPNVLGRRPQLGQNVRTTGSWAANYKSRVLPEFLSVVDDPSISHYGGHTLLGEYAVDDEGVKAVRVLVIERGKLVNYLLGRQPIRDFPASNGHARASSFAAPAPSYGNLIVSSSEPLTDAEMHAKLLEFCRERDMPYCYEVETLGPRLAPRLAYRVWTKDGHRDLVRGAVFGDLDVRALRSSLVAAGKEVEVEDRSDQVPQSVACPALLFDDLEVKRAEMSKEKLPDYPAPPIDGVRK